MDLRREFDRPTELPGRFRSRTQILLKEESLADASLREQRQRALRLSVKQCQIAARQPRTADLQIIEGEQRRCQQLTLKQQCINNC